MSSPPAFEGAAGEGLSMTNPSLRPPPPFSWRYAKAPGAQTWLGDQGGKVVLGEIAGGVGKGGAGGVWPGSDPASLGLHRYSRPSGTQEDRYRSPMHGIRCLPVNSRTWRIHGPESAVSCANLHCEPTYNGFGGKAFERLRTKQLYVLITLFWIWCQKKRSLILH